MVDLIRIEPGTGVKSLGVISTATGAEAKQLERMHTFITNWTAALNVGKLPPHMNYQALNTRILRTFSYPLPATSLSPQECIDLESALYRISLPKCGIISKLPLTIRYGAHRHMGLGITQLHMSQGLQHLREFTENYRGKSIMSHYHVS